MPTHPLWIAILLSGVGTAALLVVATLAYRRRRSRPYLFVVLAIGTLALRPIVGAGAALGHVPTEHHHTVEHLLDVGIILLLVGAILDMGPAGRTDQDTEEVGP